MAHDLENETQYIPMERRRSVCPDAQRRLLSLPVVDLKCIGFVDFSLFAFVTVVLFFVRR